MKVFIAALFLFTAVLLLPIAFVYESKHDTEQEAENVENLRRQIDSEKEKISRLKAQYSVLTQPERLEKLVKKNPELLQYFQMSAEQIVSLHDLPLRPVEIEEFINRSLEETTVDLGSLENSE